MWAFLASIAYILLAIPAIGDKFLLSRSLKDPTSYAFLVGVLGLLVLPLIPIFGLPSFLPDIAVPAMVAGGVFIAGLVFYYRGIQKYEASQIVPLTGGLVPIFGLAIGGLIAPFERSLQTGELLALLLLALGTLFMDFNVKHGFSRRELQVAGVAALCFAVSFMMLKRAYLLEDFWSGLVWRQVGGGVMALVLLVISPNLRKEALGRSSVLKSHASGPKSAAFVLLNQVVGAVATLFLYGAIYSAPVLYVPFVNAFQGLQYVFVLALATIFSLKFPKVFHEYVSPKALAEKVAGILLIIAGISMLFLYGIA